MKIPPVVVIQSGCEGDQPQTPQLLQVMAFPPQFWIKGIDGETVQLPHIVAFSHQVDTPERFDLVKIEATWKIVARDIAGGETFLAGELTAVERRKLQDAIDDQIIAGVPFISMDDLVAEVL